MFWYEDIGFRPIEARDLEGIRELRNDPSTWMYLTSARQIGEGEQQKWFGQISDNSRIKYYAVVLCDRHDEAPILWESDFIGIIRTDEIDNENRSMRIGCDIIPKYRGKGFGSKVYAAMFKYFFDQLNYHRLWLLVLDTNLVAVKLYENAGMKPEGIQRQAVWRDGAWHNYMMMSILQGEYHELRLRRRAGNER